MHFLDGKRGYRHGHDDGDAASIESPRWLNFLEISELDSLKLDADRAVQLAVQNSREYQFELENLYLSALSLTLERFEFDTQWLGFTAPFFRHFGTSCVIAMPDASHLNSAFDRTEEQHVVPETE